MLFRSIALVGVAIGWLFASYQHAQQKAEQLAEREEMVAELSAAKQQITQSEHWRAECELLNNEVRSLQSINTSLEADLREVTTRMEAAQQHADDKIRQMINSEQRLSEQFENLANRIFEHSNRRVDEQNRQSLNSLLSPLREQLDGFRRQVQDSFGKEAQERHTLTHEIRNLQQLNAQMAQEAINLTRALKGDNKTQGNWGEVVLTRVLEASGLREGYEYETQVSIENDARSRMQPDVIVRLPQGKDVVIDAKMTLVAYERYFNAEDDYTREVALQEHLQSSSAGACEAKFKKKGFGQDHNRAGKIQRKVRSYRAAYLRKMRYTISQDYVGGSWKKIYCMAVHQQIGAWQKVLSRFAHHQGRTTSQSYNPCDKQLLLLS